MRKRLFLPPTVYVHLHKDEWTNEPIALWVKDCPQWWCRVVAQQLIDLHVFKCIRLERKKDLHYRYGYIRTLYELNLHGLSPSITEDMLLWFIEHEFNKIQSAQVQWVTAHRILNLKRKKDL